METKFKTFHNLMAHRVRQILVVACPYDAFIMEEDGGLLEHVFIKVRGVSLVEPPHFTVVSSTDEALDKLEASSFDLIVTMPRVKGINTIEFGKKIKQKWQSIPVVLLVQSSRDLEQYTLEATRGAYNKVFLWSGNRNIMWTILKWAEDRLNVVFDTKAAQVRVLILVEDSPYYYSSLLPILYTSVVKQTKNILDDSLNEEHQLLKIRARPKILLATTYEEGIDFYQRFKPYLLGILSDIRYHKDGKEDAEAGIKLLSKIREDMPNLPVLLLSSEGDNASKAQAIEANFQNKNSPSLHKEIKKFLIDYLGFGDFIFRMPNNDEVGRAVNLSQMEKKLAEIPDESLRYHVGLSHFSNWFFARSEIDLAEKFRAQKYSDFSSIDEIRKYLVDSLARKRLERQRGVVMSFMSEEFDPESPFLRIGGGSLGGKARGLAFMAKFVQDNIKKFDIYKNIELSIPKTLVIATEYYDEFVEMNNLQVCSDPNFTNEMVAQKFTKARLPKDLEEYLRIFLSKVDKPIAVRSSGLLEDSKEEPFAGLYTTYMLPNCEQDFNERFRKLSLAIRLVYASVFYEAPKAFSRSTQHRTEEEKMGIIIQQITGQRYGDYFYPAISGVAQSHNFYPFSYMKPQDGVARIALGLGKTVDEGKEVLRFCPKYPQNLPQMSAIKDALENCQKNFYSLIMRTEGPSSDLWIDEGAGLAKREIYDALSEDPVDQMTSTYFSNDNVIRDTSSKLGTPILTFASVLKYNRIPLGQILSQLLEVGKAGLGCDVEMEFAINLNKNPGGVSDVVLLQCRPMSVQEENIHIEIPKKEVKKAVCFSTNALGLGVTSDIRDIVFVMPNKFGSINNIAIASEIAEYNRLLKEEGRKYLLLGPGRWGTSDHCLGVPVSWENINGVSAIVEAATPTFSAEPSQGSHFFQNITTQRIIYMTVYHAKDFLNWDWFELQNIHRKTDFIAHIRLDDPIVIKIDSKKNHGVILPANYES